MTGLRPGLTASEGDTTALMTRASALEGIASVEEITDMMQHLDDEDSSSAGRTDDMGSDTHLLLVSADDETVAQHALEVAGHSARRMASCCKSRSPEAGSVSSRGARATVDFRPKVATRMN